MSKRVVKRHQLSPGRPAPEAAASAIVLGEDGRIVAAPGDAERARFYAGWAPGTGPSVADAAESAELARRIRAEPKQCWFNARRAVLRLGDYADAGYVEGLAVTREGLLIEHGWVVRGGLIVDPTLPDGVAAYFPGLEFPGRAGIADFLATPLGRGRERSPFFHAFGWSGRESPSFSRARADAEAHALGLLSKLGGNVTVGSPSPNDNAIRRAGRGGGGGTGV